MTSLASSRQPPSDRADFQQLGFDELGERLCDLTFVVVDLETTGGSPHSCDITEIGAVKVRAGQVLGEFQTLVRPATLIPPFIAVLTGITDEMVAEAPAPGHVLPAFIEWAAGAVLVAHNAPFDLGFLRVGCERLGVPWPELRSIDTARLARRVLNRDEAADCKLATLSRVFRATTTPCHRALADARATVDVLHGLFERLGPLGIQTWDQLRTFTGMASAAQRRKRHLADGLPDGPGVYIFRDGSGRPLYIGRSRALRQRVRQYFTASEPRSRIAEMVGIAERVDAVSCAHDLDAQVREVRLIAEHKPRYNRRSKFPERAVWLVLTEEPFPRLSIVRREPSRGEVHLGPFPSTLAAQEAAAALYDAVPLRQCTLRISPRRPISACALAGMGRCCAPCDGSTTADGYAAVAAASADLLTSNPQPLIDAATRRLRLLGAQQRYEEAASLRDRAGSFLRTAARMQRLAALTAVRQLVAGRLAARGGWELAVVRHGRLVAAATTEPGVAPGPTVHALLLTSESLPEAETDPAAAARIEEAELILRWLSGGDVRLVAISDEWSSPVGGAGSATGWLDQLEAARATAAPLADRRGLRPIARPARG